MGRNKYTVEVMDGFMRETGTGYKMPETLYSRSFYQYAPAKALYRAVKKENKNAVHFYRNNELIIFKGE